MTALMTADEYLATGDERPRSTELINGEVIVNTPSLRHQRIGARIQFLLQLWCAEAPGRGESPLSVDAHLDAGNVYATALELTGLNPAGKGKNTKPSMSFIKK